MAIYNPDVQIEILKAISAENAFETPLTPANAVLSNFTHGVDHSLCTVDGVRYSGLKSYKNIKYNRISIESLFKNIKLIIEAPTCRTSKDILPYFNAAYGISLTESDIVDHPISWFDPEGDRIYECVLEIKANHPLYYGSVKVSVSGIVLDIEKIITVTDVDGIIDSSTHVAKQMCVTMTTYGVDYTAISGWLINNIPFGGGPLSQKVAIELGTLLSGVDGLPWSYSDKKLPFNLKGAIAAVHCPANQYSDQYPPPAAQPSGAQSIVIVLQPSPNDTNPTWQRNWGYFIQYDPYVRIS